MTEVRLGEHLCPACRSTESKPYVEIRGFQFRDCRRCRTLYCDDPPVVEATQPLYGDVSYFEGASDDPDWSPNSCGYRSYLSDRENIERKFASVLAHVESFVEPRRLIDVGAGPGLLLTAARARGWDGVGIEINPWAAEYARSELGLEVRDEPLEDAGFEDDSADAISMMDVLEHVPDPSATVAEAARILRPGGVLAVLTPDAGSLVSRMLGKRWPEIQRLPEHLVLFSATGLAELLAPHGLEVLGWHWIGKTTELSTLIADVSPVLPGVAERVQRWAAGRRVGATIVSFDPRTKFCLYARLLPPGARTSMTKLRRLPKKPSVNGKGPHRSQSDRDALAVAANERPWGS